jgi:drug/metabolite transporter (DMT)-like permease
MANPRVLASEMPVFQIMTIAFLCASIVLRLFERKTVEASETTLKSLAPPTACAAALLGMNVLFLLAVACIPPAQVNVLSYLWPVMVIAIGSIIRLFDFKAVDAISLLLGFAGVVIVAGKGSIVLSPLGICLAILSGLSWALLTVFTALRKCQRVLANMITSSI